jgi:hypothetical protein
MITRLLGFLLLVEFGCKTLLLSCDGDTCGAKGTSLVQDVSQALKNVAVEGFDSRVN